MLLGIGPLMGLVFVLVFGWIFSGWPRIWQKSWIPPKFDNVFAASPATLGATGNEAVLTGWTDASNAEGTDDDNTYATAARKKSDANISSNYLNYNFDAEIPVGASISKVEILPEWKVDNCGQSADLTVLAIVSGVEQASHNLGCQDIESQNVVDITADRASWTRDDLLNATFKVQAIANASGIAGNPNTVYTWSLDRIPVRVTYSSTSTTFLIGGTETGTKDTGVTNITFPEGNPESTVSVPYNDVDGLSDPQVLSSTISEPVAKIKNTHASTTYNIILEITTWTNNLVDMEYYNLANDGATNIETVTSELTNANGAARTVSTSLPIAAGAYKDLYLKLILSSTAGKSGTSTLTILGETP